MGVRPGFVTFCALCKTARQEIMLARISQPSGSQWAPLIPFPTSFGLRPFPKAYCSCESLHPGHVLYQLCVLTKNFSLIQLSRRPSRLPFPFCLLCEDFCFGEKEGKKCGCPHLVATGG